MPSEDNPFKILVADDEEQIIDVLTEHFTKWGYDFESAADGEEAFTKIVASPPDLLITDIKMPRLDGLQLIERMKAEDIELPVVVITAYFDIDNAIQALRLGAVNFFKKPFDFRAIHNTIFKIKRFKTSRLERSQALRYLKKGEMSFIIPSNIDLVDGVSSYISERAVDLDIITSSQKFYFQLAVDEAISNAILHGNFGIKALEAESEEDKTRAELYRERSMEPQYSSKKVVINANIDSEKVEVSITDEGEGFDYTELPDPTDTENVFHYHGRGIFVIRNIMDKVEFNKTGNQIRLVKCRGKA